MVTTILNYESPEQWEAAFEADKARISHTLTEKRRQVASDIDQQVREELGPANRQHADYITGILKNEFDLAEPVT